MIFVNWLIQEDVFKEDLDPLIGAIKEQHMNVEIVKYVPFGSGSYNQYPENDCVISYGSLNLISQLVREKKWIPGAWCLLPRLRCQVYYSHWGPAILNQTHVFTTFNELRRRPRMFYEKFGIDNAIFVRPDSGFKEFTGNVIYKENFETDLDSIVFDPEKLVVVAEPKNIEAEWRFIIADRKVVTGSQYRLDGKHDVAPCWDDDAYELAQRAASDEFQPDTLYSLDICRSGGKVWILEIGSFSCSGFYACDVKKIVEAASKAAWKEWKEYHGQI